MALYNGKYSCGHEGQINVIGPEKDRPYKVKRIFEGICSECWEKERKEKIDKANKEAFEKSQSMSLPELKGSRKQVSWGTTIRQNMIAQVDFFIENIRDSKDVKDRKKSEDAIHKLNLTKDYIVSKRLLASWYIENRTNLSAEYMIGPKNSEDISKYLMSKYLQKALEYSEQHDSRHEIK
jgi:hypothetical protein